MAPSVNGVTVRSADGSDKSLGDYAGNVLLIVNVASRCGFTCLLYTSPSPRDVEESRMPSSA